MQQHGKTHKTLPRSAEFFPSTIAAEAIFGSSARIYGPIAKEIAPVVIAVAYTFMDATEFKEKGASDKPGQVNQIYWREILNRAHMASAVSLVRTGRWVEALVREHDEANLMGWTACCRSLLESIGDTVDALQYVSLTLAENHRSIESSLEGSMTRDYFICSELENILIHFSHARRIAKSDTTAPASHRAKQTAEYITILERMRIPEVKLLYSELCEFMHPAASSVSCMFVQTDDRLGIRIDSGYDARVIAGLLERHKAAFRELLMVAYNPVTLTLRVLNHFDQFPLTPRVAQMDLSSIPVWERIAAALNS